MSKSKTRKRQQKALQRRLKITRKKLAESKRRITERNKHKVRDNSAPVMTARSVRFEIADRTRATCYGGLGLIHPLSHQSGLVDAIDRRLTLLKHHFPYHESDHVLNIAYNALTDGRCLQDLELKRNDEAYLNLIGAVRIPDPTTAGDFCRRFRTKADIDALHDAIDEARSTVWARQPQEFFERAIVDMDGHTVETTGECKDGMDINHESRWGYHALLISLANTKEPLRIMNRSGNRPSHEGAAAYCDDVIVMLRRNGFRSVLLRGDTDFSQTEHLDRWNRDGVLFHFGYDATKNLKKMAGNLAASEWTKLQRPSGFRLTEKRRLKPDRVKEQIVVARDYDNIKLLSEDIAEFEYKPVACGQAYRMIVIRKNLSVEKGDKVLFPDIRYFFYITNDTVSSASEIVFSCNDRCNQECHCAVKTGQRFAGENRPLKGLVMLSDFGAKVPGEFRMSNQLSMATIQSIETLHRSGHSNREIARILGIDRGAVNNYVKRLRAVEASAAVARTGSEQNQNRPNLRTGSGGEEAGQETQNRPNPHIGGELPEEPILVQSFPRRSGPKSLCEQYREVIAGKLDQGLSSVRIHQDLKAEHGFLGGYHSVRRFIDHLGLKQPLPFRRMEVSPGDEAQVDFGTAALVIDADGKRRRPWMFRIVLSQSRRAYSEVVWRQTTDNFIAALENAFHYFGGVPKTLVIDNLKAAVKQADWFDPELHPKLQSFAAHYGTAILPTRPYTPEHKGKVESSVKYAKNNALKGRTFGSLAEQNEHLLQWEENVADTRIHGTTKKQVRQQFEDIERPALMPLPRDRFANFHEAKRAVSRDGHLEVDKAFYSAPAEYIGRRVWVRWDARLVRVFNDQWRQIALHSKAEPGRFRTDSSHIPAEKVSAVERGTTAILRQIAAIGPQTKAWSELVIQSRGVPGVRVLVGLKALAGKHTSEELEQACGTAVSYGACRLKSIRNLLKRPATQTQQALSFIEEHPIIRPLSDYSLESLNAFRKERNHERKSP